VFINSGNPVSAQRAELPDPRTAPGAQHHPACCQGVFRQKAEIIPPALSS